MRKLLLYSLLLFCSCDQARTLNRIEELPPDTISFEPLKYLASDKLIGRALTQPEINMAAAYIAKRFGEFDLKQLNPNSRYLSYF
jgi:hypothetical protein